MALCQALNAEAAPLEGIHGHAQRIAAGQSQQKALGDFGQFGQTGRQGGILQGMLLRISAAGRRRLLVVGGQEGDVHGCSLSGQGKGRRQGKGRDGRAPRGPAPESTGLTQF